MPMSHWHYEMNFAAAADWMPALTLREDFWSLDPGVFMERNNAAAIEFTLDEATRLEQFVTRLLEKLTGSDFMLAFVEHPVLCSLHHHKQLCVDDDRSRGWIEKLDETSAGMGP